MSNQTYGPSFYATRPGTSNSANLVANYLLNFIKPESVVDIGCGTGAWLNAFKSDTCKRILGLDGNWVPVDRLAIPRECFVPQDLNNPSYQFDAPFDLAISLEVAEHIETKNSQAFVGFVVGASSIVLWSAAIPFQGGTGHINEQFPDFWFQLFREKGYVCFDVIRPQFWQHPQVAWFYAQNMLLYVDQSLAADFEQRFMTKPNVDHAPLALVHPHRYLDLAQHVRYPELFRPRHLLQATWRSLRHSLGKKTS